MRDATRFGLAAFICAACGSTDSDSGGGEPEGPGGAGAPPGIGAAGGADGGMGGDGEGGAGGSGGSAGRGLTTITVVDAMTGAPVVCDVIVNRPDGVLVGQGVTAADGTVAMAIPVSGSVSILFSQQIDDGNGPFLGRRTETVTFAGEATETVVFNAYFAPDELAGSGSMSQYIAWPPMPGAAYYRVQTTCAGGDTAEANILFSEAQGCTTDDLYDIVLLAYDASGTLLDYGRLDDQPFLSGGSASHDIGWQDGPIASVPFEITNIPDEGSGLASSYSSESQGGRLLSLHHSESPLFGPSASVTLPHVPAYGSPHCQIAQAFFPSSIPIVSANALHRRCSPAANLAPLELDVARLSYFDYASINVEPLRVFLTEITSRESGDVVWVVPIWLRGSDQLAWSVTAAPGTVEFVSPELPPELAEYGLLPGDQLFGGIVLHIDDLTRSGFEQIVVAGVPDADVSIGASSSSDVEYYSSSISFQ